MQLLLGDWECNYCEVTGSAVTVSAGKDWGCSYCEVTGSAVTVR